MLLWIIILFCSGGAIYVTFMEISIPLLIVQEILFLGIVAFCLSIYRSTYYVLERKGLFVRSGPFRWTILYSDIEMVLPKRNLWSSAALSTQRLHIYHRGSKMGSLISPEREASFMNDLAKRCPHLQIQGRELR